MHSFIKGSAVALAGIAVLALTAAPSQAAFFPFDSDELGCRKAIAKNFGKAVKSAHKTVEKCHKSRNKGKVLATVDCNIIDVANADPKDKFSKTASKVTAGVDGACTAAGIDVNVLEEYPSCSTTCEADLGLSNPLANYTELGSCLGCMARELGESWGTAALGLPTPPPSTKPEQLCHQTIGKAYGKYIDTIIKDRQKCQDAADKEGALEFDATGCSTSDEKGKVAKALSKGNGLMDKKCVGADVSTIDSCTGLNDLTELKNCNTVESESAGGTGLAQGYELEATLCPATLHTRVQGATTKDGNSTQSLIEIGWTGVAHYGSLVDDYILSGAVTCPGTMAGSCGTCTVDGISSDGPHSASFLRCANDVSMPCTTPFGADAACGGGTCTYVLGPPLNLSAGNNPTCSLLRLANDIVGTADPDLGSTELDVEISASVYLGISLDQPCPRCVGDTTAHDGVTGGTCDSGLNAGDPCDAQGFDETFAAQSNGHSVSLDCPPAGVPITGSGLKVNLEFTTGTADLPFEVACSSPNELDDCACAICTGDSSLACRNDAECAMVGAGTCSAGGGGVSREQNGCADGICTDLGGGTDGICNAGPFDGRCDGVLTAEGNGFIACNTNFDCDEGVIGIDAGLCTISQQRLCFLDPILATGIADTENPLLVSTYCQGPVGSTAINSTAGLPGPSRVHLDALVTLCY
jgi:hypothetical protein